MSCPRTWSHHAADVGNERATEHDPRDRTLPAASRPDAFQSSEWQRSPRAEDRATDADPGCAAGDGDFEIR
jgi:hypothetical protein